MKSVSGERRVDEPSAFVLKRLARPTRLTTSLAHDSPLSPLQPVNPPTDCNRAPRSSRVIVRPQIEREFAAAPTKHGQESPVRSSPSAGLSRKERAMRSSRLHLWRRRRLQRLALPAGPRSPIRACASRVRTCTRTWPSTSCTASAPAGPCRSRCRRPWPRARCRSSRPGRVNELQIENTGVEQVFIQAGDIVKGGKQDRVLTVSFLLPANSGRAADRLVLRRAGPLVGARQGGPGEVLQRRRGDAVASGAAGDGRSAARQGRPTPGGTVNDWRSARRRQRVRREHDEVSKKQRQVWDSVATTQRKLSQRPQRPGRVAAVGHRACSWRSRTRS